MARHSAKARRSVDRLLRWLLPAKGTHAYSHESGEFPILGDDYYEEPETRVDFSLEAHWGPVVRRFALSIPNIYGESNNVLVA